ncbi:hypothetical protein F511_43805 [Dorcoceras hygrometricum]|uniref:Uncharacterized protein n=1 Tax=Dorcoceras hygrometricum TaxID=472368 RepID=A0A2Z7BXJ7_9LAMI|nr:hypothetical protein F511_43805 [Dorcoceras hygrometricum]
MGCWIRNIIARRRAPPCTKVAHAARPMRARLHDGGREVTGHGLLDPQHHRATSSAALHEGRARRPADAARWSKPQRAMSRLLCGDVAPLLVEASRYWPTMIAQALGIVARYWTAAVESRCAAACVVVRAAVRPCGARNFHGGAGRPMLRRSSGDVVMAGLNSSRVWFGPVPGSP